jgi:hypothetical protein
VVHNARTCVCQLCRFGGGTRLIAPPHSLAEAMERVGRIRGERRLVGLVPA